MPGEQPTIPEQIFAQASPRSIGGRSLFEAGEQIAATNIVNYFSEENVLFPAIRQLQEAGFDILQATRSTINIAGSQEVYERAFDARIFTEERPVIKEGAVEDTATYIDSATTDLPGLISTENTAFANVLEGVAIEEPRYLMATSRFAPTVDYWHLDVPDGVAVGCNATRAHRNGVTGKGVKVAMVDSGWFKHPYFSERGYRIMPVTLAPGSTDPLTDNNGHGTSESANIVAVAPDVEFFPVKWNFANSISGFNAALGLGVDIITCSWGSSKRNSPLSAADQALAASIATAVGSGTIVIFSAGNGHWGFPGQHPDVISAGGVFLDEDGSLQASNYSSGFMSNIYPDRQVPDVCGLVGMLPHAAYILLPLQPGCTIDVGLAGKQHPDGDETANDDGWAAISGTSAAAPQLAGVAALIKQACPHIKPEQLRDMMKMSAIDVTDGNCSPSTGGNPAVLGPDSATGHGLIDAHKAVLLSKIRCETTFSERALTETELEAVELVLPRDGRERDATRSTNFNLAATAGTILESADAEQSSLQPLVLDKNAINRIIESG